MTSKRIFVLLAALLLATVAVGGLFGQVSLPGKAPWESPQSQATQGRIRSNADNIIRADAYVKPAIWLGYTSYTSTKRLAVGFGTTISDLYLGLHYYGGLWQGYKSFNFEAREVDFFGSGKEFDVYDPIIMDKEDSYNTAAVVIGFMDMGIRLAYHSTHQIFNKNEIAVPVSGAHEFYKNYKAEMGHIIPQIVWSMAKNLTDNGIRPYAGIDLDFYRANAEYEKYESASFAGGRQIAYSRNYFAPKLTLGMGGYTILKKDSFSLSADLEAVLELKSYDDNAYSYGGAATNFQYKTKNIKGSVDAAGFSEESFFKGTINPSLSGSWTQGDLALRFQFQPRFNFSEEKSALYAKDPANFETAGTLYKEGIETETSSFTFNPRLRLGAQWRIIPQIALNAGGLLEATGIENEIIKGRTYTAGNRNDRSDSTKNNTSWGTVTSQLSLGFNLFATDNLTFEVTSGVGTGNLDNDDNAVSIFGTNNKGLLNFTNVLVSLRF